MFEVDSHGFHLEISINFLFKGAEATKLSHPFCIEPKTKQL